MAKIEKRDLLSTDCLNRFMRCVCLGDILLSRNLALMFHMHNIDTVREFRFLPPDSVLHSIPACGGIYVLNTDQWCAGWGCCRRKDLLAMGESSLAVLKHWAHIAVIDVELLYKQMHKLVLTAIVTGGLSIIDWSEILIPNPAQSGLDSWSQREQQPRTTTD